MADSAPGRASDFNTEMIEEFRANGGRVGGPWAGTTLILIHHIGARSGTERVTPLGCSRQGDGRFAIVASNGGSPAHPDWYYNLKANPRIEVEVGTQTFTVLAEELDDTARAGLWPKLVAQYPSIGEYQATTTRQIPVLMLTRPGSLRREPPVRTSTGIGSRSPLVNPVPWREAGLMTQTQHGATRATPAAAGQARDDLADRYARDGYSILPGAFTPAEVAELRAEALRICRGDLGPVAGMEPGPPDEADEAVIRRYACIHFPHKLSPLMRQTLAHPVVVAALTRVIGPDVKAMQSMLFTKGEGKPGQAWHQDEFFIPTRDRSLTAAWIALDDATTENGCLWVLPGSHRRGVIYPDHDQDDPRFDCTVEAYDFPYRDADAVPVQVAAGSVVLFNGYLLHRSLPNTARSGLRRALVNHYMSAQSLLPWTRPPDDVHVAKWDSRDIVMVAGQDPYAWRGTTDISRPHIRPNRDGGCHR